MLHRNHRGMPVVCPVRACVEVQPWAVVHFVPYTERLLVDQRGHLLWVVGGFANLAAAELAAGIRSANTTLRRFHEKNINGFS